MRIKYWAAILAISITVILAACGGQAPAKTPTPVAKLGVYLIDVGQGDASLIDLGETEILIDGGDVNSGAVNYIRSYIDGALDVIIATHNDPDHIGGLTDVLGNYQVKDIWMNGSPGTTETYTNFMKAVNAEGAAIHVAEQGNIIQAGPLKFEVLSPSKPLFADANDDSIVLNMRYFTVDFLFMADASSKTEARLLTQSVVPLPDCDVYKVGQHGNRAASSFAFLKAVMPEMAVYSCAKGNADALPHQQTLRNLDNIGAKIYGTNFHGSVVVKSDGLSYDLLPERPVAPIKPR